MNIQRALILALAAGSCMLCHAGVAGVTVSEGHLVNDQNERVTVQVAPVPLAADISAPLVPSTRQSLNLSFGASRNSVQLPRQGGAGTPITINDRFAQGWDYFLIDGARNFDASRVNDQLTVTAVRSNTTCRTIADQIDLIWIHRWAAEAFAAINASQWSLGPCPPAKASSTPLLLTPDAASAPPASLTDTDVDTAVRNRSRGGNAVRILLSAGDVSANTMSARLTMILDACERHRMWCLLDPSLARTNAEATANRGAELFARLRAGLLNRRYIMFVIPPGDSAARALRTIRSAGLSHVTVVSPTSLAGGGTFAASTLLGTDAHHALALMGTPEASRINLGGTVPMLVLPALPTLAAAEPASFPVYGVHDCKIDIKKADAVFLSVDCAVTVNWRGAGMTNPIKLAYVGGSAAPRLTSSDSWLSAYWDPNEKVIVVWIQANIAPSAPARVGFLTVERRDSTGAVARARVEIAQEQSHTI